MAKDGSAGGCGAASTAPEDSVGGAVGRRSCIGPGLGRSEAAGADVVAVTSAGAEMARRLDAEGRDVGATVPSALIGRAPDELKRAVGTAAQHGHQAGHVQGLTLR